ncbi:MAG: DUF370 domain-containing protein [Turneriella sp.]|nr:DUF370 domain-containing protein [Turneriella sp.]
MKLLHVGFSNSVAVDKIVAIITPDTAVAKRLREQGRESNHLIDCTMGRKLRSMVLTDSEYIFLSAMRPEALMQRLERPYAEGTEAEEID